MDIVETTRNKFAYILIMDNFIKVLVVVFCGNLLSNCCARGMCTLQAADKYSQTLAFSPAPSPACTWSCLTLSSCTWPRLLISPAPGPACTKSCLHLVLPASLLLHLVLPTYFSCTWSYWFRLKMTFPPFGSFPKIHPFL